MTVFDDGRGGGPELHISCLSAAGSVARWDGHSLTIVSPSPAQPEEVVGMPVLAMMPFQVPGDEVPSLFMGGRFITVNGMASHRFAQMYGCPPSPGCAADFDGSGTINSSDFFDFLTAFFADDTRADITADGVVNSADLFLFLELFFSECR